ncbi:MAG: hypothetical protein ACKODL_07785 [Phenylobacterium sp.]
MVVLRWIAFLPAAAVGGWLAYMVGGAINNTSTYLYVGEIKGFVKFGLDFINNMFLGIGFVFCGVKIAPRAPKFVGITLAIIVIGFPISAIFTSGIPISSIIEAIQQGRLSIVGVLGTIFGACATAYGAVRGEVQPLPSRGRQPR